MSPNYRAIGFQPEGMKQQQCVLFLYKLVELGVINRFLLLKQSNITDSTQTIYFCMYKSLYLQTNIQIYTTDWSDKP